MDTTPITILTNNITNTKHLKTLPSHHSYFSASTPAQTENSFMDSELFEQIRAFEPDGFDDFDFYGGNVSMK